jgi:hypothetical protein
LAIFQTNRDQRQARWPPAVAKISYTPAGRYDPRRFFLIVLSGLARPRTNRGAIKARAPLSVRLPKALASGFYS